MRHSGSKHPFPAKIPALRLFFGEQHTSSDPFSRPCPAGWPVPVSTGIGGCFPQCAALWQWELSKSTEGEDWDRDGGDGHRYSKKPFSWDWEQLLRKNVLPIVILGSVLSSPDLWRRETNLLLLHDGVWGYFGSGILAGWVSIPSGETLEEVPPVFPPAHLTCLGSPWMGSGEPGRGQPKGPGFPRVDGRGMWAQGNVDLSLLPVLPGTHVS